MLLNKNTPFILIITLLIILQINCVKISPAVSPPAGNGDNTPATTEKPADKGDIPVSKPSTKEIIPARDTERLREFIDTGKTVTVEGYVVTTFYANDSEGKPTFLNFNDPRQGFLSAVIWEEDRYKFPNEPEAYFLHKTVRITGPVEAQRADPKITLRDPSQIIIIK